MAWASIARSPPRRVERQLGFGNHTKTDAAATLVTELTRSANSRHRHLLTTRLLRAPGGEPRMEFSRTTASGVHFFRGHHWVHLRCGPVTRSPSRRWLGRSASSASFPPRMRPKLRRFLTFPPVGLSPTEHVCLFWTHSCAKNSAGKSKGLARFSSSLSQRRCGAFFTQAALTRFFAGPRLPRSGTPLGAPAGAARRRHFSISERRIHAN